MAENYFQCKQYKQAENHYRKAAAMCPVKFMPLYSLTKIYYVIGRKDEAIHLAEKIINKPIKISSTTIIAIQRDMIRLLEEEQNNGLIP